MREDGAFLVAANGVQVARHREVTVPRKGEGGYVAPARSRKPANGRRERMKARAVSGASASGETAAGRVVLVCTLWAIVHSLLASKQAKDLVRRLAGPRYRDGLYRVAYNVQSVVSLAWAARWFLRQPDREIYRAGPPVSWLLRAGQVVSLGVLFSGV